MNTFETHIDNVIFVETAMGTSLQNSDKFQEYQKATHGITEFYMYR